MQTKIKTVEKNSSKLYILLSILVVAMPLLQALIMALFHLLKDGTGFPCISLSDEAVYASIVKTWSTKGCHVFLGNSIGYYGYNATHALVGTGSAWNSLLLAPYAIIASIFGYSRGIITASNIFFLCIAHLLFLLLTKPSEKGLIRILILEAASSPVLLYLNTTMTELLRFSYSIIIAGLIYYIYKSEHKNFVITYIVTPLFILFSMQAYIFFVFVVPVYMWLVLRNSKIWKRIVFAILALLVSGGGSYYYLHLVSSNYDIYKTEKLMNALTDLDIVGAIKATIGMFIDGLKGMYSTLTYHGGHGLFTWYVLFLVFLSVYSLVMGIKKVRAHEDSTLYWISLFSLALFIGAFMTMYSMEPFTFYRSSALVAFFVIYLYALEEERLNNLALVAFAIGLVFVPLNHFDLANEKYLTKAELASWTQMSDTLESNLDISRTDDPWDATVLCYTLEPRIIASLPAGTGVNLMFYPEVNEANAKYLLFSNKEENLRTDWLEQNHDSVYSANSEIIEANYTVVFSNNEITIYKRK